MCPSEYETNPVRTYLRIYIISLFSLLAIKTLSAFADTGWQKVLIFVAVLLAGTLVEFVTAPSAVILTEEGIREKKGRKKKVTRWGEIIQVSAYTYDGKPALILVPADGYKLRKEDRLIQFYIRNRGKLICLPDKEIIRRFVAEYYGPLDIDLSDGHKKD